MEKQAQFKVTALDKTKETFSRIDKRLKVLAERAKKVGQEASSALSAPLAAVGISAGLATTALAKVVADFEGNLNGIEASLKPANKELSGLEKTALALGKSTKFSATESAAAIEVLAKNGLKYKAIVGGALENSLLLASASNATIQDSADLATDAMGVFSLQASDMRKVVDSMLSVMNNSKFGFDDYRLALANGAGAAAAAGKNIDEFNATIAATSSFFDSGQTAGTSFKTFIERLVNDTSAAVKAQKELGLSFFDSEGNMRSMADIAEQLKVALAGISEEKRIRSLSALFGSDAAKMALALSKAGRKGVEAQLAFIGVSDAALNAKIRMKGLPGAILRAQAALEGFLLSFREAGISVFFTGLLDHVSELFNWFSELDVWVKRVALGGVGLSIIAVVIASASSAIGGLILLLPVMLSGFTAIAGIASSMFGTMGLAIVGITAGVHLLVKSMGGWKAILGTIKKRGLELGRKFSGVWRKIKNIGEAAWLSLKKIGGAAYDLFIERGKQWLSIFKSLIGSSKTFILSFVPVIGVIQKLKPIWDGLKLSIDDVKSALDAVELVILGLPHGFTFIEAALTQILAFALDIPTKIENGLNKMIVNSQAFVFEALAFVLKGIESGVNGLFKTLTKIFNTFIKNQSAEIDTLLNKLDEASKFFGGSGVDFRLGNSFAGIKPPSIDLTEQRAVLLGLAQEGIAGFKPKEKNETVLGLEAHAEALKANALNKILDDKKRLDEKRAFEANQRSFNSMIDSWGKVSDLAKDEIGEFFNKGASADLLPPLPPLPPVDPTLLPDVKFAPDPRFTDLKPSIPFNDLGGELTEQQEKIEGLLESAHALLETDADRLAEEVRGWNLLLDNAKISKEQFDQLKLNSELSFGKMRHVFESVASGMSNALDQFVDTGKISFRGFANSIIKDLIKIQLKMQTSRLFGLLGKKFSSFGFLGKIGRAISSPSFDGGGFTGRGSRSGGVDGKGGFPAILHPNETVIDHTKGGGTSGMNVTLNQTVVVRESVPAGMAQQIAQHGANMAVEKIRQIKGRGGKQARAF